MAKFVGLFAILFSLNLFAEDISLTIEEHDTDRNRASILVLDSSQVPLGTIFRVHSKTGTCEITITERVNDHIIGKTAGCEQGVITPGMKLAYSQPNSWEEPARTPSSEVATSYDSSDLMDEILDRTTVFIGHNFSSQLEGNVYADGNLRNLDGDTAFSFGIKGRIYDFTDRLSLSAELGYETPRTLDQVTSVQNGSKTVVGTQGYSPRLSLWSLSVLGEAQLLERLNAFAGLNYSIPSLSNSPFRIGGDIGFQAGTNYQLYPQIAIEGLIKITNMNFKNDIGQTTDVSLAGLELRGRYSF